MSTTLLGRVSVSILAMKRMLVVSGIVVGVLLLIVIIVPLFINVDSFRPDLEKKISAALNRQVHIGKLEASILSGGANMQQSIERNLKCRLRIQKRQRRNHRRDLLADLESSGKAQCHESGAALRDGRCARSAGN